MPLDESTLSRLRPLGWPDDAGSREALAAAPPGCVARVSSQHRSGYEVVRSVDDPEPLHVQPPPEWLRPQFPPQQRACVGDWVVIDAQQRQILALLPRRSVLKRAAAGEHQRQQLIAANVDHVLVLCGLDHDFNPRRLERYLLLVRAGGAAPVVVLSKADRLADLAPIHAALAGLAAGEVPIHPIDARDAGSAAILAPYLGPGRTVVLVGSSGAGKSTLTNTLLGRDVMRIGAVRASDSRGRHTTTRRALIALPQGACLIDTPGMRELRLTGEEALDAGAFGDIEALAAQCRFRDCLHRTEPDCAVQAALAAGRLESGHLDHFRKLALELSQASGRTAERGATPAAVGTAPATSGQRPSGNRGRR